MFLIKKNFSTVFNTTFNFMICKNYRFHIVFHICIEKEKERDREKKIVQLIKLFAYTYIIVILVDSFGINLAHN